MNRCILIGRTEEEPTYSITPSGTEKCSFVLAVDRDYLNVNGVREKDYINVIAWRELAVRCHKAIHAHDKIAIWGSVQTSTFVTRNGVKCVKFAVIAEDVECDGKSEKGIQSASGDARRYEQLEMDVLKTNST